MSRYGVCTFTRELLVQFGGLSPEDEHTEWEVSVEMECTYPGDPGQTYGPPERCWPPEPMEFEWRSVRVFAGELTILETDSHVTAQQFFNLNTWERLLEEADEWASENHEIHVDDQVNL